MKIITEQYITWKEKIWIAGSQSLKHINGWSKIRGGGSHKNQNEMLSSAGSENKVMHKMNNEMKKTRGYLSKKGGHASQRGRTGAALVDLEHPSPSPPTYDARRPGGARAPDGWKPAFLLGRAGVGISWATATARAAHVHRRFPPERWNRNNDPAQSRGLEKYPAEPPHLN
jgi:hypothetical protein